MSWEGPRSEDLRKQLMARGLCFQDNPPRYRTPTWKETRGTGTVTYSFNVGCNEPLGKDLQSRGFQIIFRILQRDPSLPGRCATKLLCRRGMGRRPWPTLSQHPSASSGQSSAVPSSAVQRPLSSRTSTCNKAERATARQS